MKRVQSAAPLGFTLIELMIVVAVIGMLASVAIPSYQKAAYRSRAAERGTLIRATSVSIEDTVIRLGKIPAGGITGAANPPGTPTPYKRPFNNGAAGWKDINILVQGNCYYSYAFQLQEPDNAPAFYQVSASGDLDGDGITSDKTLIATRTNGFWERTESPEAGNEDLTAF